MALRTTYIKIFKLKVIKIRTGCQYVSYSYYSENLNWAACGPRVGHSCSKLIFANRVCLTGVFALLQVYCFLDYVRSKTTKEQFRSLFVLALLVFCVLLLVGVVALTWAGEIRSFSRPTRFLWSAEADRYVRFFIVITACKPPMLWPSIPRAWQKFLCKNCTFVLA